MVSGLDSVSYHNTGRNSGQPHPADTVLCPKAPGYCGVPRFSKEPEGRWRFLNVHCSGVWGPWLLAPSLPRLYTHSPFRPSSLPLPFHRTPPWGFREVGRLDRTGPGGQPQGVQGSRPLPSLLLSSLPASASGTLPLSSSFPPVPCYCAMLPIEVAQGSPVRGWGGSTSPTHVAPGRRQRIAALL